MYEFLLLEQNLPFAISLGILIIIAIIEGLGSLIGGSLSGALDSLMPDVDLDLDIDLPDLDAPSLFTRLFAWLRVGKVPIIMLLLAFLCAFTIAGLIIQKSAIATNGSLLTSWLAALIAIFVSLPITRMIAVALETIIPGDETSAVSRQSFIGMQAIITTGVAKQNYPAQARLSDQHGQTHYVMVEPEAAIEIQQGQSVKLIKQHGVHFIAEPV